MVGCEEIRGRIPGMTLLFEPEEVKMDVIEHIKNCPSCFLLAEKVYAWGMMVKDASHESEFGHLSEFDIACVLSCQECEDEGANHHLEICSQCRLIQQKLEVQIDFHEKAFMERPEVLLSVSQGKK